MVDEFTVKIHFGIEEVYEEEGDDEDGVGQAAREESGYVETFSFGTKAELRAFLQGVSAGDSSADDRPDDYEVVEELWNGQPAPDGGVLCEEG